MSAFQGVLSLFQGDALLSAGAVAATCTLAAHLGGVALCKKAPAPSAATAAAAAPPATATARRRRRLPWPWHGYRVELHFLLSGGSRHLVLQTLSLVSVSREEDAAAVAARPPCLPARLPTSRPSLPTPNASLQTLWLCAMAIVAPVLAARWRRAPASPHAELLHAASAIAAFCSLLFQLKALLVFEPGPPPALLGRAFRSGTHSLCWDVSRLPSRTARAYIAAAIGLLWVGLGGALLFATELLSEPTSLTVYYALAAACVTTGAFTTHGLAGFLHFSAGSGGGGSGADVSVHGGAGWRFWQPFRGGTAFVLAQVGRCWGGRVVGRGRAGCMRSLETASRHCRPPQARLLLSPPFTLPAGAGLGALLVCHSGPGLPFEPGGCRGGLLRALLGGRRRRRHALL